MWAVNDYEVDIQYLFDYKRFGQSLCFMKDPENQKSNVTFIKSHSI